MSRLPLPLILPLFLSVVVLLLVFSSAVFASTQHVKRHNAAPPIEFATTPQAASHQNAALIKPEYNQFAPPPPASHEKQKEGGGLSKGKLKHWMEKIGLHPNRHQVNALYAKVQHHRKHDPQRVNRKKEAWKEINPNTGKEIAQPQPVSAGKMGVLPPGTPRKWDREGENPSSSSTGSPVAAAVAPLPEPMPNTIPSPTSGHNSSSILPPVPADGLISHKKNITAPVTEFPSTTVSNTAEGIGTSGSINPTSTSPPSPPTDNNGGGGKQKTVAGIPVVDDTDMKTPPPVPINNTSVDGKVNKSGGSRQPDAYNSCTSGMTVVIGVVLVVVFFAI